MSAVSSFANRTGQSESRRDFRIKENLPVTWYFKDKGTSGKARIRNISDSGMMLSSDAEIADAQDQLLVFEPNFRVKSDFVPSQGRMVWSKRSGPRFSLGIQFVNPAQDVSNHLHKKIQERIAKSQRMNGFKNAIGGISTVALLAMVAVAIYQQVMIAGQYEQSTRLLLDASSKQADIYQEVANDLSETRTVLADTQSLLTQSREQIAVLQNDVQAKDGQIHGLQDENVKLLDENVKLSDENVKLTGDISALQEKLRPFEAEVQNLDEGKSFSSTVRQRLREIKFGIREVKHKAHLARIAAQKEQDRIALEQGNRGYIIQNGEAVKSQPAEKKIKIDVEVFE